MPTNSKLLPATLIVGQGVRPAVNQGKKGIETGTNHNDYRIAKMANLWQYCILFYFVDGCWLFVGRPLRVATITEFQQRITNNEQPQ